MSGPNLQLQELHSFVCKFLHLFKGGYEANIHVSTQGGVAHINLQAGLGQHYPIPRPHKPHRKVTQIRRRVRREGARNIKAI